MEAWKGSEFGPQGRRPAPVTAGGSERGSDPKPSYAMDTADDQEIENPGGGSLINGANGTNGTNGANGQHQTPEGSLRERLYERIESRLKSERKMSLGYRPNVEISQVMPRCDVSKTWIIGHLA
ncbi:hypothetical protein G5I_03890 [Acromyrmex echinatior]|uniref:Uncharacterized protein n=1 Tax=Acromyrmex echinatior TaxID=103372 RepID=F4WE59_ACREC|nr:hypothetical protein G5I_03890 [Acromyrmex echinatior]